MQICNFGGYKIHRLHYFDLFYLPIETVFTNDWSKTCWYGKNLWNFEQEQQTILYTVWSMEYIVQKWIIFLFKFPLLNM